MKALLLSLLMLTTYACQGQAFSEWFRQQKTKKDYLVQQIAALQVYAGTLRKGYEVASQGIDAVQQIKNGDLGLHQVFFGSLEQANPAISNSAGVADILSLQQAIVRQFKEALLAHRQERLLLESELAYVGQVKNAILQACLKDLETLWQVLSSGSLEMKDDGRLRKLEALYQSMQDRYQFTQSFVREAQLLALQRAREKKEVKTSKALYGLP